MREPKFSDAPCYGKEFDAQSKICRVCLANQSCQRKFLTNLGASKPGAISALRSFRIGKRHPIVKKGTLAPGELPSLAPAALLQNPVAAQVPNSSSAVRRDAA
jgi:hypothetical protein